MRSRAHGPQPGAPLCNRFTHARNSSQILAIKAAPKYGAHKAKRSTWNIFNPARSAALPGRQVPKRSTWNIFNPARSAALPGRLVPKRSTWDIFNPARERGAAWTASPETFHVGHFGESGRIRVGLNRSALRTAKPLSTARRRAPPAAPSTPVPSCASTTPSHPRQSAATPRA